MARLSTGVDVARRTRLSGAETRAKLLAVARAAFSRAGFDLVGVRELAADAGVDAAMVNRAFGSKEELFAAVAADAFALEAPFDGPLDGMGLRIAKFLLAKAGANREDDLDDLAFLVRSATSPIAAPILSAALHARFVAPLARHLGGADAQLRATLLTACVLGFSTLRFALGSPPLEVATRSRAIARLGALLQACLDE